ncbi:YncE family protein, partial [Myxococcus sp. AB025B]
MKRHLLAGVLAAALGLCACEDRSTGAAWTNASGSVALSRDDAFLYVVDADTGVLAVVETASGQKVGEVKVGAGPERVVVGPDDTVYVSNRGARSVSVIRRGDWNEAARVAVGVEPMGLTVSPNGDTLYVVNSTALDSSVYGTLMAVDTRTLEVRWELPVGEEPRGVALVDGGRRALVSLFRHADLVTVDLSDAHQPRMQREGTDLYARANTRQGVVADEPIPFPSSDVLFRPRGMADVVVAPDGARAFAPTLWAREDSLTSDGRGPGGSLYG